MAELNETLQGNINLPEGPPVVNEQMQPPVGSPEPTIDDNVPAVSDFDFDDVADVLGSPAGDLASLQLVDPAFESMIKNAAITINSSPPITGIHSIHDIYPGKATQHYNPYEQNTPPNLGTSEGKAKLLQQGLYKSLTTPNKHLGPEGYMPDVEFGIRETNFDRFYASRLYDDLGFHPWRNNEEYYNDNSTFWDENQRMRKQMWNVFQTGFTSSWDSFMDYMSGSENPMADLDGAQEFQDAMRIGTSTKTGFGGATNRFLLNGGYTFGIVANIAVEEIVMAAAVALTRNPTTAAAATARTVTNVGRFGKALNWGKGFARATAQELKNSFFYLPGVSKVSAGWSLLKDLNKIENARHFFTATGKGALNFIAPNTMRALSDLNTTKGVARGIHNIKQLQRTFGGFYRDAREINLAIAESKLEAGLVYNEMIDNLYHEYMKHNGEAPPSEHIDQIHQKATAAAAKTFTYNAPLIYISNRIVLGTIFRGMPGGLGRLMRQQQKGMGKRIFRNSKVSPAASKAAKAGKGKIWYDGGATFLQRLKNKGVTGGLGSMGAFALRYTGANFAEGFQELSQEVISKTAKDYYTGLFVDPAQPASALFDTSLDEAIKAQISPQGFEVFMSGFMMGRLVQPVQRTFTEYLPQFFHWSRGNWGSQKHKEAWTKYKEGKENFLERSIKNMNEMAEDPHKYFDKTRLNAVEQKQLNRRLLESTYASDMLSFMDDKDQASFTQLDYLFKTGTQQEFRAMMQDWMKLSDEDLKTAFPEFSKDVKNGKLRGRIESYISRMDKFSRGWEVVQDKYPNPFDSSQFVKGSKEYTEEALREIAWDHSTKLMMYTSDTFTRALERHNSIFQRLSNDSAISKMNPKDISVLLDLKSLKTEIELLESEIKLGATTPAQQEQLETKQKRLELLKNYLDVITDPENFVPTNKEETDIALSADMEYQETEETGDDVFEFKGKKFKASVKPKRRVGTFDRRKINKLKPAFMSYINFLAEAKGEFIKTNDLNEVLKDIVDYKFLKGRSQTYFRAIENIQNPERLSDIAGIIAQTLKTFYDNNQVHVEKSVKKYVSDIEKNELINQLAGQGVYPDGEQVVLFFQEGIIPTIFHSEAGQVSPTSNKEKWETVQNIIKSWQQADQKTDVKPGETLNEEELTQEDEFDDIVRQTENISSEVAEATNSVLVTKWRAYVKGKVGTEGKVLSWKEWQNTKQAKDIKEIRSNLNNYYLQNLTQEQQQEKSFDNWLIENQRAPEVYTIINSKGGSLSDIIITDSDVAQTDKLDRGDEIVQEDPSGIHILKKLVSGQTQEEDEYYFEIVDNNMNNLYEQYKMIDPNGKVIRDHYKTLGEAVGAHEMIIGLLPDNSTFNFQGEDLHWKEVLQDNKDNQFVVITTPKTFNKGRKLYLRPLETANDRNTSFQVDDIGLYRKLDTSKLKPITEEQNLLKLRQSEPIKMYAHRAPGESSHDAEVRLSDRLQSLTPENTNSLKLKVSKNENFESFNVTAGEALPQLGTTEFTNPKLRVGSEELTVAVILGQETLGYLQGPTAAILLDEYGKTVNPLNLTEDQVDDYFQIYKTTKTQIRTKEEQLQIIKNNYASSILLNEKLKELLSGDIEVIVPVNSIKGLDLRVSPGKMLYSRKGEGALFSELVTNKIDGENIWVLDNRSDGEGGVITNITDDNLYEKTAAIVSAASEETGYNPANTLSRYVAVTRLANGTFTFVELKADQLTEQEQNDIVLKILNAQDKTLDENINDNDEVISETLNFKLNEDLKSEFYIFGKSGEFIDIEVTPRGDVQVKYFNTKKKNEVGGPLRISYTINENDLKGVKESNKPFEAFLTAVNNKIKFKDAGLATPIKLKLTKDKFRKAIPAEATPQDLGSVITNFEKELRGKIRMEAVIADSAAINNIINTSTIPSNIQETVEEKINKTDNVMVNAEMESPELTPEYMQNLFKNDFQGVEDSTIKLIARKLATNQDLTPAERTIYINKKNPSVRESINLLKLTYLSGVIEEGGMTDINVNDVTSTTEKSPSRKIADELAVLEEEYDKLEDSIYRTTYETIIPDKTKSTKDTVREANIAANEAVDNDPKLKELDKQIEDLKKKLAPKVINENFGQEHIEQIDQFITWAKQNLPEFIQIQDIQDLSARLKENGKTVGMFVLELNNLFFITPSIKKNVEGSIYVGAQTPFKYHEAFHGVFRMLLSEAEIKKYLAIAKKEKNAELRSEGKKLSEALNELKSSHSIYNNLTKEQLEDRLYEEYLADKFEEFKMNPKGTNTSSEIKSLFTRILEWIKAVFKGFSKNELTTLFENIDAGKYKTTSVQTNRFTTEAVESGVSSQAPKVIPVDSYTYSYNDPFTGKEIVSLANTYMTANDQRTMIATISSLFRSYVDRGDLLIMSRQSVLDKAISDYTKLLDPRREYYTAEDNGIPYRSIRRKLKSFHKALKKNKDIIAQNVTDYLSIYDNKYQIEQDTFEEFENSDDTNVRRVDEYGKSASQIGGINSLSTFLRTFIATTIIEEQDMFGNKETLEGVPIVTTVDYNFAYSGLLKALANKTTDLEMLRALVSFSSSNKHTAAVASNIFKEAGINDPASLLELDQMPKIANTNFIQKVIKGFNQFKVDYMFAHKDTNTDVVFIYAANKKDDSNMQLDQWAEHFEQVYPSLLSDAGKKKALTTLNLFYSKLQNPKERSRAQLDKEAKAVSENLYDLLGIQINAETIKYSILSTKVDRKVWEEAIVQLGLSAGADPITPEDVAQIRNSVSRGENLFLDNQTNIPEKATDEDNTTEEIDHSTGVASRLRKLAKTNSYFDETVGATVFRDPKGNFIYAHQMPTFHLVKVAEMSSKDWAQNKIKENSFFSKNYLLNNEKFLAHAAAGKLKVTRFIGSKEGKLDENEHGTIIENRGLTVNQKPGVSFGESTGAEFIADVINSYVYHYNRNSQKVPLNPYITKEGKDDYYIEAPIDLKVMSDASTNDFVSLPIEKMIEQDESGDIKLTDHSLDALINNILQTEYNRVLKEVNPETAETDVIEGFNTDSIKKGKQLGQRGKRFVRSRGFITRRKSKIKRIGGIQAPLMSKETAKDIVDNNQKIILRGGKAQSKIGLDSGQQSAVLLPYEQEGESRYADVVVKNKGLVSVNNINLDQYIKDLGNAVSTKPIAGKKKQNTAKIGEITYYFQRLDDAKFFSGKIDQYVYEFITSDTTEETDVEAGVEEVQTPEGVEEQVVFFESDNFVEETLINAAKEELSFEDAMKRVGEDKLKEIIEERILTDFFDFRRLLSNIRATEKLSVEITSGLGEMVRPQKGKRGRPYYKTTEAGKKAMKLYNLKENDLDYNLAQIYMHQFINARSMNEVLLGDHAKLFTNFTDEIKRAKMQNAAGPSAASALTAPKLGINHTFMSDNSISLFTYHDPEVMNKFSTGTTKETDAFMVGTVKAFRHFWFGIGNLTTEQANLLDKIQAGEQITVDDMWGNVALGTEGYKKLNALINSKKFVYGDGQTYLKMSFFVLTPELTSYKDRFGEWKALPQMEQLHHLRVKMENFEKGKETVAIAIPTSGSKMMKKNVVSAEEMYSNKSIEELQANYGERKINTGLNPKWMRLQVVNPSNKIEIVDPRQMKQLVTSEQSDNVEVVIDGKVTTLGEVRKTYHKSVAAQTTLRFKNRRNLVFDMNTALDEIGKSKDLGKTTPNLRSFLRYAMAGLESSQAKTQMLEFFSFDEVGNPKYDLNNPITIDKFQQLFLAYFSKGVLAGRQPGVSLALASSYGVKPMRRVKKVDENGQPIETEIIRMDEFKKNPSKYKPVDKFIDGKWVDVKKGDIILQELQHNVYDAERKIYYSEFMMAPHHRDVHKFIKPGDIIPKAVAEALGIRIPSQDKHSAISLRLVDFLPVYYGSTAMFSKELIEISGADFDIDKLYTALKDFYYEKGDFKEYGKAETEKGRYTEYIRYIISQVNRRGSTINEAVINWSTNDSQFLDAEQTEDLQDEIARKTASELVVNADLFNKSYTAKILGYILEINDNITDQQIIKLYNKNEDLYGALKSLGLPVTLKEYKAYVEKHGEPYEGAINNNILDQRIALVANEGVVKPIDGREIGYGNEPANLEPLYEIRDFLEETFPELADFANPEDIDPDNMLGLIETWNSIKTGEGGIGAAVRPNVVLGMLGENGVVLKSKKVGGKELYPQIRFNKITYNKFGTPYSIDGKTTKDKATRTQYLISSLITMMTDNAKERLADVLGVNKNSLAVLTNLSSLGVPIQTSILLLKNPVIKLGYEFAINKPTPMSPGISKILQKRQKFLNKEFEITTEPVTTEALIEAINNDWLDPTIPLATGFGDNLTGQTPEGYTDKQASVEYAINRQFITARRVADYTGHLGSLVDLLSGFGRTMEVVDSRAENFKKLGLDLTDSEFAKLRDDNYLDLDRPSDAPFVPFDARPIIKGDDFRATYYKIFKEFTEDLLPAVFITRTDNFIKMKNTVIANMVRNNQIVNSERRNAIEKDVLSYLTIKAYRQFLLNSENGIEKLASLQNGMIYDDVGGKDTLTIESITKSIRNYFASKGRENYFIEKFVNLDLSTNETNKANINRLKGNNWTKMSDSRAVDLQASFAEIYSEPALRPHAYDLVHYLLVKDGMQFANNTFLSAIPAFMFDQILNSISAGHRLLKSETATTSSYDLIFGMGAKELANEFAEGYLKSNKNGWLLPQITSVTSDETRPGHIDSDGNLQLNMFAGVNSYMNQKGEKVVKGKKFKFKRKGKSIFIDTTSKEYKRLVTNIGELSNMGVIFTAIDVDGKTHLEMNMPLYFRNQYQDAFGRTYTKDFQLNQAYKESQFSQTGDVLNMLEGEELIVKGWQATYVPVELVGSNQATAVAFANGEVPTYNSLKPKNIDPIDNILKNLNIQDIEKQIEGLDFNQIQELYDEATNTGKEVSSTNKGVKIDGKKIDSNTPAPEFNLTDAIMKSLSVSEEDIVGDNVENTNLLLNQLGISQVEKSNKSDEEIKVIKEWWADPKTNRFEALKQTKRSNLDGILKEFNNFDGTAERFIDLIKNCK